MGMFSLLAVYSWIEDIPALSPWFNYSMWYRTRRAGPWDGDDKIAEVDSPHLEQMGGRVHFVSALPRLAWTC